MSAYNNSIIRYRVLEQGGIVFAVACAIFLIGIYVTGVTSGDAMSYLPYANQLANGIIPAMEYPQFALVFMAIPRIFSSSDLGYTIAFVAEVFVFFMIGLIVVWKLARRYGQSQPKIMLAYTILMLLIFQFVVDRYDIFPAVLTLVSLYFFITKRYVLAFAILSIATMTKLYPAVLFPIYMLPLIINRDWSNALKGAGVFIIVLLLIFLPFFLSNPDTALNFVSYNSDRPIQVESTAASFIAFGSVIGLTKYGLSFGFGSDNITGPWSNAVGPYLTPLIFVFLILIYATYAYVLNRMRKEGKDSENNGLVLLGGASLLAITAFIIFGKVFSAQYVIWIIPFVVFMLMTSIDSSSKKYIFALSVIAILLTQLNYLVNMLICGGCHGIVDGGMMIILARNIVMLILFVYVIKVCLEKVEMWPWQKTQTSTNDDGKS